MRFAAERDGLEFELSDLTAGNRLGDAQISAFFDQHLDDRIANQLPEDRLEQQVRTAVTQSHSEGTPRITDVASRMGMSSRTLQRRLAAEGHVFGNLVESARRDLAEGLLRRTEYSLAEVAFLTGYAEQSTFSRAFKRWNGRTPAEYRRSAQSRG